MEQWRQEYNRVRPYAAVFKRYSQAKLNMMREALSKLDRQANERSATYLYGAGRIGLAS